MAKDRRRARSIQFVVVAQLICLNMFCSSTAVSADFRSFNIERQPLTSALLEYGRQSGLSVSFTEAMTAGKMSQAVHGQLTNSAALDGLLDDTGLTARFVDERTLVIMPDPDFVNRDADSDINSDADKEQRITSPVRMSRSRHNMSDLVELPQPIDEVVVVGSQIVGADVRDSLPVTVWDASRIDSLGAIDAGDVFRAMPFAGAVTFNGVDTFFAGVNSARGDVASINLRDLGTGNTLVLLNGRRLVLHPGVQTEGRVPAMTANMNVLPTNALQRIEILRDGASPVYGADAVAGVVNNVLKSDNEGFAASLLYGFSPDTELAETDLSLQAGAQFNDGRTHLQLFATISDRAGVQAAERPYSRSSNLLPLVADTPFADNANLNNSSVSGAWGQYRLPVPVRQNGVPITSPTGLFHLQPTTFPGCLASVSSDVCIDDSFIDTELFGDHNSARQLIPDLQRSTFILTGSQRLPSNVELYGEFLSYNADSTRVTGGSAPLSSTPITIPASNYWNPFGPVFFSDGTPNPNRLPGIDAPPEGLNITLDSSFSGSAYRISDAGFREINVDNSSFRILGGFRGTLSDWNWDTALLHSEAETHDVTRNRVSSTLFQQSLALETADAYNPFNGSGSVNPGSLLDGNPNPPTVVAPFSVTVSRKNRTSLTLADLKLSNSNLLQLRGGAVSASIGIEARREQFSEDRDGRFDGTTTFTDIVTGEIFESDIVGTSVTADSSGTRQVLSAFSELALPLVNESAGIPFLRSLQVQLAARLEDHSDVGSTFQPRFSYSWHLFDQFLFRGSYSRGVRVPNLPQLNAGTTRRVLAATDWYRCQALLNKGIIASLGSCGPAGQILVESSRSGSQALQPEDYTSTSIGAVFSSENNAFLATIDFWRVEQNGIVGLFGAENQIAADFAGRLSGGANGVVERAPITANDVAVFSGSGLQPTGQVIRVNDSYVNLDRRRSSGVDISLSFDIGRLAGSSLIFDVNGSRLISVNQSLPDAAIGINALNEPAIEVLGAGNLIRRNSRPRWRLASALQLQSERWRGALTGHYVSDFVDTSATNGATGAFFPVDSWLVFGAYWQHDFSILGDSIKNFRIGVRNLLDEAPPLADESFGFNAAIHNSRGRFWYARVGVEF